MEYRIVYDKHHEYHWISLNIIEYHWISFEMHIDTMYGRLMINGGDLWRISFG